MYTNLKSQILVVSRRQTNDDDSALVLIGHKNWMSVAQFLSDIPICGYLEFFQLYNALKTIKLLLVARFRSNIFTLCDCKHQYKISIWDAHFPVL